MPALLQPLERLQPQPYCLGWAAMPQSSDGTTGAGCEHCCAPFSSHEQVKIPNQFSRVPSMLLNTVLVSSVHFQQNVAFVHCSGYFLCAISKHFLGVAFSQLLPPAADSFTVNIYVRNSKNFFTSLAHSVLWQAGWLNNYGQVC